MKNIKCRILVVPTASDYGREPEFWYYESPESCCATVGLGILFGSDWPAADCWSRVEVWDERNGRWISHQGDPSQTGKSMTPATWEEAHLIAPEVFETMPASSAPRGR